VPVYATLDQEFEVRVTQGTITGGRCHFANYGQALSYMFTRAATRCPNVQMGFWYGGSSGQRTNLLTMWRNITTAPDWVSVDPYAQGGSHPGTAWTSRLDDIRTGVVLR
jgi:hypothetical protein